MRIPLVDLKIQYKSIKKEIDKAISSVINDTAFIGGKYLNNFTNNFAKKYGVKNFIGVANGTDALYISLKSLGIKKGDEVITVSNTWISSSETISQTGAKPVFVDINENYFTIDTGQIEKKINKKTKAIIVVHLYGQVAQIDKIKKLCKKYNLYLIEDCAQAHFAEFNGKKVGTFGDIGTFSFFPGKNLGAYGDAGGIITNNTTLAKKIRMFANHGALKKHSHEIEGVNSRLDGMQAAILSVKLKYITKWTNQRIKNAGLYNKYLKDISEIEIPQITPNTKHVFHLYVIKTKKRNELKKHLENKNISTGIHYPEILPFLPAYKYLNYKKEDFPISNLQKKQILSLPMYPELTELQIKYISNIIKEFFKINEGS